MAELSIKLPKPKYGQIVVLQKNGDDPRGHGFPLVGTCCIIGRAETADIRVSAPDVSNIHCNVIVDGETGEASLEVLGVNTQLNAVTVESSTTIKLNHRDVISLGGRRLRFEYLPPDYTPRPNKDVKSISSGNGEAFKAEVVDAEGSQDQNDNNFQEEPFTVKNSGLVQSTPVMANRSVTFGPDLSPEQFDHGLPPSTPLKRGATPRRSNRHSLLKFSKPKIDQPLVEEAENEVGTLVSQNPDEEVKEVVSNILTPSKNVDNPIEKSSRISTTVLNTNNDANLLNDQSSENLINFSTNLKSTEDESLNLFDPEMKLDAPFASTQNGGTPRRASRHSILKMDKSQMPSIIKETENVITVANDSLSQDVVDEVMNKVNEDVGCIDSKKDLLEEKLSENLSNFIASSTVLKQTATSRRASKRQSALKMDKSQNQPMQEEAENVATVASASVTQNVSGMSDEIKKDVSCANGVKNLIDEKLSENLSSSTTPSKTLKQTPRRASTRRSTLKRDESQTQPLKEGTESVDAVSEKQEAVEEAETGKDLNSLPDESSSAVTGLKVEDSVNESKSPEADPAEINLDSSAILFPNDDSVQDSSHHNTTGGDGDSILAPATQASITTVLESDVDMEEGGARTSVILQTPEQDRTATVDDQDASIISAKPPLHAECDSAPLHGSAQPPDTPKADYTNVEGVKELLQTPRQPKTNASDGFVDLEGVSELLKTPVPRPPKTTNFSEDDEEEFPKTPAASPKTPAASPKTPQVKRTDVERVGQLFKTPAHPPKSSGIDYSEVEGVADMLKTPAPAPKTSKTSQPDYSEVEGVADLLKTPAPALKTSKASQPDYSEVEGVADLLKTPAPKTSKTSQPDYSEVEGVADLLKTPAPAPKTSKTSQPDFSEVEGVADLLKTPAPAPKTPKTDVKAEATETIPPTPKADTTIVEGVSELFKTPAGPPKTSKTKSCESEGTADDSQLEETPPELTKTSEVHPSKTDVTEEPVDTSSIPPETPKTDDADAADDPAGDEEAGTQRKTRSRAARTVPASAKADYRDVTGVKRLLQTPKAAAETPKFQGVDRLFQTPEKAGRKLVLSPEVDPTTENDATIQPELDSDLKSSTSPDPGCTERVEEEEEVKSTVDPVQVEKEIQPEMNLAGCTTAEEKLEETRQTTESIPETPVISAHEDSDVIQPEKTGAGSESSASEPKLEQENDVEVTSNRPKHVVMSSSETELETEANGGGAPSRSTRPTKKVQILAEPEPMGDIPAPEDETKAEATISTRTRRSKKSDAKQVKESEPDSVNIEADAQTLQKPSRSSRKDQTEEVKSEENDAGSTSTDLKEPVDVAVDTEPIEADANAPKSSRSLRKPSSRSSRKDQSEEENDTDSVSTDSKKPVEAAADTEPIEADGDAPKSGRSLRKPSSRSSRKDHLEEENDIDSVSTDSKKPVEAAVDTEPIEADGDAPKSGRSLRKPSSRSSRKDQSEEEKPEENDADSTSTDLKRPTKTVEETENVQAKPVALRSTRKQRAPRQPDQKDLPSEIAPSESNDAEENTEGDEASTAPESSDPSEVEDVADLDETETKLAPSGRGKRTRKADPDSASASSRSKRAKKSEQVAVEDTEIVSKTTATRSKRLPASVTINDTSKIAATLSPVVRLTRCKAIQSDSVAGSESGSRKRAAKTSAAEEKVVAEATPKKKAGRPKRVPEKAAPASSQSVEDSTEPSVSKEETPAKGRGRRRGQPTASAKSEPESDQSNSAQPEAASRKKTPVKRRRAAAKSKSEVTSESDTAAAPAEEEAAQESTVPAGTRVSKRAVAQRQKTAEPKSKKRRVGQASVTTDEDAERVSSDEDDAGVEDIPASATKKSLAKKPTRSKKVAEKKVTVSDETAAPPAETDSTKKKPAAARTTRKKAAVAAEPESVAVASPRRSRRTRV